MEYQVGDFVKGNSSHINAGRRMSDVGVVISLTGDKGAFVSWFSDKSTQFAYLYELEHIGEDE